MKYLADNIKIPLQQRQALNDNCLQAIMKGEPAMTPAEIFNQYTGNGGLHGLQPVDYANYKDFSEAKKEIEQGQFFTSDDLCKWVVDCIRPDETDTVADLTCGKGAFFNHLPEESKIYGCEIEPNSYRVACHLYGDAHIELEDIRNYDPGIQFSLVVGNPPFNLPWKYKGRSTMSQSVYIMRAAELLLPGGLLAVIVPQSYLGERPSPHEVKRINSLYNYVTQIALDNNAFAWLGVSNFPTKLLILQRRVVGMKHRPFVNELITEKDSYRVYADYVEPVLARTRRHRVKILQQTAQDRYDKDAKWRFFRDHLFQIKKHPATREHYDLLCELVEEYRTQKKPENMDYMTWQKNRLHSGYIMDKMQKILRAQNHREENRVALVKSGSRIYYKAYSKKVRDEADRLNRSVAMDGDINRLIPFGDEEDYQTLGEYGKLMRRKHLAREHQATHFSKMKEDAEIKEWLRNWELTGLTDEFETVSIKLNPRQLIDSNLTLQKHYAYLQWSQGAGKTVSGTAQGMYRLEKGQVDYVFVVSSAISIETTWAPFLQMFNVPHTVVRCRADLRKVYAGDFVLITLGRVQNYQKAIKKTVKLCNRRIMLMYDEAQNSATLESGEKEGRRTKAMLACFLRIDYKLLMSGTSINNNVVEAYPQLYLLYNASCNMLSMAEMVWRYDEDDDEYCDMVNEYYAMPFPPYMEGMRLFRRSHLPEKLTVFGVVKSTPDIFNAEALRDIIQYTMLTRTFVEVTGKDLERRNELPAVMNDAEMALYKVAQEKFFELEHLYFTSKNMDARKKAQARIMAQITIMLRICAGANTLPEYTGSLETGKLEVIFSKMETLPNQRIAIGVRETSVVETFARAARERFPRRPVFTVTGSELQPRQRRDLIYGPFEQYDNSVLISTQQSLSESMSIDSVDHCFIPELHWNFTKMSQYYYRFIRYTSTREKHIYFVNYPDSIETNLIYLLVSKERMLRFLKGQDISFEDLFADLGFDLSKHTGAVFKQQTEDGPELIWGTSQIAA